MNETLNQVRLHRLVSTVITKKYIDGAIGHLRMLPILRVFLTHSCLLLLVLVNITSRVFGNFTVPILLSGFKSYLYIENIRKLCDLVFFYLISLPPIFIFTNRFALTIIRLGSYKKFRIFEEKCRKGSYSHWSKKL